MVEEEAFCRKKYEVLGMNQNDIKDAIGKGICLYTLYRVQDLDEENIEYAINKGIELRWLYRPNLKMSQESIALALDKGKDLFYLYSCQKLDQENILISLEKERDNYFHLSIIYENQRLNQKNVKWAIDNRNGNLKFLYKYRQLDEDNLRLAIETTDRLEELFTLSEYQKKISEVNAELLTERHESLVRKGADVGQAITNYAFFR